MKIYNIYIIYTSDTVHIFYYTVYNPGTVLQYPVYTVYTQISVIRKTSNKKRDMNGLLPYKAL